MFLPKNGEFFTRLEEIGDNIIEASDLLESLTRELCKTNTESVDYEKCKSLSAEIECREHKGDHLTHQMLMLIADEFITPIEHKDLFKITKKLDDIVDCIDNVCTHLTLFHIKMVSQDCVEQASVISKSCRTLRSALSQLRNIRKNKRELSFSLEEIHRLENEGDTNYRKSITSLNEKVGDGTVPMYIYECYRMVKLHDHLEKTIDSTEDVSDLIEGVILTHK